MSESDLVEREREREREKKKNPYILVHTYMLTHIRIHIHTTHIYAHAGKNVFKFIVRSKRDAARSLDLFGMCIRRAHTYTYTYIHTYIHTLHSARVCM